MKIFLLDFKTKEVVLLNGIIKIKYFLDKLYFKFNSGLFEIE